MNSMPQHESPRGSGHTLFFRHQLIIDCSVERRKPPSVEPVAETTSVVVAAGCAVDAGEVMVVLLGCPASLPRAGWASPSLLGPIDRSLADHVPPAEEEDRGEHEHLGEEEPLP